MSSMASLFWAERRLHRKHSLFKLASIHPFWAMEESDDDLLERARRLCLAAQVIAASLPVFSSLRTASGGSGNQDEEIPTSTKKSRGYAKNSSSTAARKSRPEAGSQSSLSLPVAVVPATASTALVTRKRSLKNLQKSELSSTNQEVLPDIIISDEQRRLREIEKIRHAQERARARVSRTNQSDQLEAERENESRRQQLLQLTEVSAEKARLAEQSRLRAEERIRTKRQLQLTPIEKQQQVPICPEKPAPDLVKIERFRRKTLARLHGCVLITTFFAILLRIPGSIISNLNRHLVTSA